MAEPLRMTDDMFTVLKIRNDRAVYVTSCPGKQVRQHVFRSAIGLDFQALFV